MKELEFYLDGKENGLVVLNKDGDILSLGRYHQVLFKNIDLLKATTEREKVFDYDVAIILNYKKKDQRIIPNGKLLKPCPDYYEYIDLENDESIIISTDNPKELLIRSGYFTFTENPNERITDYDEGKQISEECYRALVNCIALEQRKGNISKSDVDHIHSVATFITKRRIYETTLNLRIMRGFELVRINKFRKELEFKVFPFDNNVDKYKNIYFAFSKDYDENISEKISYNKINNILNNLKKDLNIYYPYLLADYKIINVRQIEL